MRGNAFGRLEKLSRQHVFIELNKPIYLDFYSHGIVTKLQTCDKQNFLTVIIYFKVLVQAMTNEIDLPLVVKF